MPKVSILMPACNVEKFLRECMDSVVNQTLKDIEIICIDDGSRDSTGNILDEYAQHIDMKIQNGMSEEEAIGDFGPVKELAAEILEAYRARMPLVGREIRYTQNGQEKSARVTGVDETGGLMILGEGGPEVLRCGEVSLGSQAFSGLE